MDTSKRHFPSLGISYVLMLLLLVGTMGAAGCSKQGANSTEVKPTRQNNDTQQTKPEPVQFTQLTLEAAPKEVKDLAQRNREKETITLIAVDSTPYLLVTRGVKTTGGYNATIKYVRQQELEWGTLVTAGIQYTDPEPGQIVTQVLTYPVAVAKLELHSLPDALSFELIQPGQAVQGKT